MRAFDGGLRRVQILITSVYADGGGHCCLTSIVTHGIRLGTVAPARDSFSIDNGSLRCLVNVSPRVVTCKCRHKVGRYCTDASSRDPRVGRRRRLRRRTTFRLRGTIMQRDFQGVELRHALGGRRMMILRVTRYARVRVRRGHRSFAIKRQYYAPSALRSTVIFRRVSYVFYVGVFTGLICGAGWFYGFMVNDRVGCFYGWLVFACGNAGCL